MSLRHTLTRPSTLAALSCLGAATFYLSYKAEPLYEAEKQRGAGLRRHREENVTVNGTTLAQVDQREAAANKIEREKQQSQAKQERGKNYAVQPARSGGGV